MAEGKSDIMDAVALLRSLVACPSVTPHDAGAQGVVSSFLEGLGFEVFPLPFGEGEECVHNFFARRGDKGPHLCFAGHTDVVPPGDSGWSVDPFSAHITGGKLYGRGTSDMKGAIAAFCVAVRAFLSSGGPVGSISFLITGDEEGPARNGTVKVLEWMQEHDHIPDFCLVGEPTNPCHMGEMIKIGRRGSLNATVRVYGTQGHVAYPHRADNPVHRLIALLTHLTTEPLDAGTEWFEPSCLQVTSIDVGNSVTNVIPAVAKAQLNIRFNERHTGASLERWLKEEASRFAERVDIEVAVSGESFRNTSVEAVGFLSAAIAEHTGRTPKLDTGGGTSDARFIAPYCPVAEFGLVGATMHKADEHLKLSDFEVLCRIYTSFLERFFENGARL